MQYKNEQSFCNGLIRGGILDAEDLARAQGDLEAAADQGHDWNDYDEIDLYGADWDSFAVRDWD